MDIWPPGKRSAVMGRIRCKDTKPELIVDLKKAGWNVIVLWECGILRDPFAAVKKVLRKIRPEDATLDYHSLPDKRTVLKVAKKRLQWKLGG